MDVLGILLLKSGSFKEIYRNPNSNVLGMGSLYTSGFFLGLFEAYCTLKGTWGGLEDQFSLISAISKNPLSSFLAGFLGAILIWGVFTIIGGILLKEHDVDPFGIAVVTACATIPLCVVILFPLLDYFGVSVVPFIEVPFGWLITLIVLIWVIAAEIRAISSITMA